MKLLAHAATYVAALGLYFVHVTAGHHNADDHRSSGGASHARISFYSRVGRAGDDGAHRTSPSAGNIG